MKIVLLGSGNVATHLGSALQKAGHEILQVWSRTQVNALQLAGALSVAATDELRALDSSADIYIISVKDDAIGEVASSFPFRDKLLVHTSGTVPLDVFGDDQLTCGVFYPLQTFSKHKDISFSEIPVLIEGSDRAASDALAVLAGSISRTVERASSEQRAAVHLAAVFACNFSNHLYTIAKDLLAKEGLDFRLLLPLITETAEKIRSLDPKDAQTGPAARNDQVSINKHKSFLEPEPALLEIYTLMTNSILRSRDPQ